MNKNQPSGLWIAVLVGLVGVACAQGVGNDADDDDDDEVDASRPIDAPQAIDAPQPIDARPPIDARIVDASPLIDAPVLPIDGGGGLFCASTADCSAGTCCFPPGGMGFCLPGSEPIPGLCIPDT